MIEVEFDCESKGKKYSILKTLKSFLFEDERDGIQHNENWNIFRENVAERLFYSIALPKLKLELEEELNESAQKMALKFCGEQFKKMIEIKPYKPQ